MLRFTPERARWVTEERWRPHHKGYFTDAGYVLAVSYSDARELMMDILKYGPDVGVLGPAMLRQRVANRLKSTAASHIHKKRAKRPREGSCE